MKLKQESPTVKLALSYFGVIMAVSITFSVIFYLTSISALHVATYQSHAPTVLSSTQNRLPVLPSPQQALQQQTVLIQQRLLLRLCLFNVATLFVGGILSYYLARRSLRPIEDAMSVQQQFISNASHELKTPLSALHLHNEVSLLDPRLTLTEAKKVIATNVDQIIKLEQLSASLLQLAKVEQAQSSYAKTQLQPLIDDAVRQLADTARKKHISITVQTTKADIYANASQITQVLVILLDNALKFSQAHSTVAVTTTVNRKFVGIQVQDQGPGIAPSNLPHIFERFYQGDASHKKQGFGLGLAIAKTIIQQHHGTISASSSDTGATFTIRLPLV